MDKRNLLVLAVSLLACLSAGFVGSFFTVPAIASWYGGINTPAFSPPNWVFAPVWTVLYVLMGLSLYLVARNGIKRKELGVAVVVFAFQLSLNVLWSLVFFGMKNIFLAFVEIIALWLSILATIVLFNRESRVAAILLLPYLLWVSFAAFLNYSIWMLN